jgi:LAO/AO transport system kinase
LDLVKRLSKGEKAAIARAITLLENDDPSSREIMKQIYSLRSKARVVGITGPSGVGKSCLADRLIETYRKKRKSVGVIAVDPTSPFTGGAILGDRIRMQRHSLDKGVFIRSMGSRGSLGGLSQATKGAIDILSAGKKDVILVETVGIGQAEVDINMYADTVLVVLVPELGDEVQALKAGLLEIADVFVVNKADHEGADKTVHTLLESLTFSDSGGWKPPILKTVATSGAGIRELLQVIEKHWNYLDTSGAGDRKKLSQARDEVVNLLRNEFLQYLTDEVVSKPFFKKTVAQVASRKVDPRSAASKLFSEIKSN